MAVLIEAYNLIIPDKVLERTLGLKDLYYKTLPNKAYCFDGVIHRLGFMDGGSLTQYIHFLENELNLVYLDDEGYSKDFAVVEMFQGLENPCRWLKVKHDTFFKDRTEFKNHNEVFAIAWHIDKPEGIKERFGCLLPNDVDPGMIFSFELICYPYGWNPDTAIISSNSFRPEELEEVEKRKDGVIVYRNKRTGRIMFTGTNTEV